ncbi:MAG: hypothetical protein M3O30_15915 [Planctomycetota bacterium]|nr:hypothetical protein [Planctomycetota bacterium]
MLQAEMGDTALEHIQKSPENQRVTVASGAESGAFLPSGPVPLPPDLTEVIAKWSRLSPAVQAAILTILRASL